MSDGKQVRMNDFQVSEHFNLSQFTCPHCGSVKLSPKLVLKLEALRTALGNHKIIITHEQGGGYRCPEFNATVPGAAPQSRHLFGDGIDMRIRGMPYTLDAINKAARRVGFTGIGLYDDHVHLDVRPSTSGRVAFWDYRTRKSPAEAQPVGGPNA